MAKDTPTNEVLNKTNDPKLTAIIVGIIVVGLVLAGFLALKPKKKAAPVNTISNLEAAAVSITKNGFDPATISVKKNQEVTFTNNDDKAHRVFSDPFPTGKNLPGFDSQKVLMPGDSFTYVFEKTGSFTYTDYLNPTTYHGTVEVK